MKNTKRSKHRGIQVAVDYEHGSHPEDISRDYGITRQQVYRLLKSPEICGSHAEVVKTLDGVITEMISILDLAGLDERRVSRLKDISQNSTRKYFLEYVTALRVEIELNQVRDEYPESGSGND